MTSNDANRLPHLCLPVGLEVHATCSVQRLASHCISCVILSLVIQRPADRPSCPYQKSQPACMLGCLLKAECELLSGSQLPVDLTG